MGIATVLDRAIAIVAPRKGLQRAAARQKMQILNSGYGNYGASTFKKSLKGWLFAGGSHREDIEDNISVLRQRSRDLYMGVPVANGAIKTMRTNVVGRGLKLKPSIDREVLGITAAQAQKLEKQIEREWALWAESSDCDIQRIDNFYELQQLAFLNWLMSGDCLALLPIKPRKNQPYDLRVQLVEADRLSSPNYCDTYDGKIVGGVECAPDGEVIAYHISEQHPLSYEVTNIRWKRVEAYGSKTGRRNVLHIMTRERIEQRRGVPFLAPVIESLKQLGKYTDAELVAAVVSGMFSVFIEKKDASEDGAIGAMIPEEQQVDAEDENSLELGPGVIMDLNPGETVHDTNPGRPNTNFSMFVEAICQQIGASLEIPYELLVKRFNSSYTASKGALEEAWKMFQTYRAWLAADFCQPIYEEWLTEAVAKKRISAPGFFTDPLIKKAYCQAGWNGPAKGVLDPEKEVDAAEKRVRNGFSTRSSETREMTGGDYHSNVDQLRQEEKELSEVRKIAEGNEKRKTMPAGTEPEEEAAGQQRKPTEPAGSDGK